MVTTGVTDGHKETMRLQREEIANLDYSRLKDGTIAQTEEVKASPPPKTSTIDDFFKKRPHLNKSKLDKSESVPEEIESS